MPQTGLALLDKWDSFYVIVGSAAGALIGLQFVVLTLIADRPPPNVDRLGAAFSTPTLIHFTAVLGLSALLRVPWEGAHAIALTFGLLGAAGAIYTLVVLWRMRAQDAYRLDFEDWLFHIALPFLAYLALGWPAWLMRSDMPMALFVAGGAALALLLDGIHNAWDAISYHVMTRAKRDAENNG